MLYRRLGSTGLKTSALVLGTGGIHQIDRDVATDVFRRAYDLGITHFDTAESYGATQGEVILGDIVRSLGPHRDKYILATKAFTYGWSDPTAAPHEVRTLNRKYLMSAIDKSLRRLGTDYVDLYYCHEMDPDTPVEETVSAMSDIVRSGKVRYWALSNWNGTAMGRACDFADRYGHHHPIVDQVEYNMLHRSRAHEAVTEADKRGLGIICWGPLAGGLLSGKYLTGVPANSRADSDMPSNGIRDRLVDGGRNAMVAKLAEIAGDIGCTVGQMALAWTLKQPRVSASITFSSNPDQLAESASSIGVIDRLTPEVLDRIAATVGEYDQSNIPEDLPLA